MEFGGRNIKKTFVNYVSARGLIATTFKELKKGEIKHPSQQMIWWTDISQKMKYKWTANMKKVVNITRHQENSYENNIDFSGHPRQHGCCLKNSNKL